MYVHAMDRHDVTAIAITVVNAATNAAFAAHARLVLSSPWRHYVFPKLCCCMRGKQCLWSKARAKNH
jgi:hypothetical protein